MRRLCPLLFKARVFEATPPAPVVCVVGVVVLAAVVVVVQV
jgi:hypothetical protein